MDSSQRTKLIIGGVVIALLAAIAVYSYRDVLFPEREAAPAKESAATSGGVEVPTTPPTTATPGVGGGKAIGPKR